MSDAFLYGFAGGSGGAELDFQVVTCSSGSALPAAPRENTIAVISSVPVTGYHFRRDQPEIGKEGMIWFCTGEESSVSFNALAENTVQVDPLYAKQYVGGSWVSRKAWIWQNGSWIAWPAWYLYDRGDVFGDVTGGWAVGESIADAALEESCMTLTTVSAAKSRTHVTTKNPIDLSGYSTMCVRATVVRHSQDSTAGTTLCRLGYADAADASLVDLATKTVKEVTGTGELEIRCDVSGVTGSHYVIFGIGYFSMSVEVSRVWLE